MGIAKDFAPCIPLFPSPVTTSIVLGCFGNLTPVSLIAPVVAALPILCPNLQRIGLHLMPRGPLITDAVLEMLLTINQTILQNFNADLPLTEGAGEVICKLPNLRELQMDIGGSNSLPTLVLPNLTKIEINYDHDHGWLQAFRGATLEKLTSITFYCRSRPTGDFLEAFESVTLTTPVPATLSEFTFFTSHLWRPNCRSLLPFTQLKKLSIELCCRSPQHGCPSAIDDDIITDLARAMPKLEVLILRENSCITSTGVTTRGLAALACYCPNLSLLLIHFQAASLDPSEIPWATPGSQSIIPREDCALTNLHVSGIPLPEGSISAVAQTLLLIFPHLNEILHCFQQNWQKVEKAIGDFKSLADRSGEKYTFATPRSKVDTPLRIHT